MEIKQFEDKNLAHYSYAILSEGENKIILIDPARDPKQYLAYAKENEAQITGIIETHPHADFVSGHLELHQTTGATIYTSRLVNALYPHQTFDDRQDIQSGKIKLSAINTPGHSPDSICILLEHEGRQKAVFTGDTLFIGDCGRPDLRPDAGDAHSAATKLAKQMYRSLRDKLMPLYDDTIVYPAHGAGTLCGKALSKASSSTIGEEKKTNWSLQEQTEEDFVNELLEDQPFVPAYFSFDVELNKKGATVFGKSTGAVKIGEPVTNENEVNRLNKDLWIIDVRDEKEFKKGHLPHSLNLMQEEKFETWLGSIIKPNEQFYLTGSNEESIKEMIERAAAIGYETQVAEAFVIKYTTIVQEQIDIDKFKKNIKDYTIIDVRNSAEIQENKIFENSLAFPLGSLREDIDKIPTGKPIVVHCASGYRSAVASSLIQSKLNGSIKVFDLGEAVKDLE